MDETPREPVKVSPFVLRHFVRIAIGAVLLVAVGGVLSVWMPYQREQRITRMIQVEGQYTAYQYYGPDWIPESVKDRLRFLDHIQAVNLTDESTVSVEILSELGSLTRLENLSLKTAHDRLESLQGLKYLKLLDVSNTPVTDVGLLHLKGLTSLKLLRLDDTQVTAEGRAMLRKALPSCETVPSP